MLKIFIADLQDGVRVPVEGQYDPKSIDVEFSDMNYPAPILIKGEVERNAGTVRFEGLLTTKVRQTCGRCLKENIKNLHENFDWIYETEDKEVIDPVENIRELLILDHPLVYLCRENCKGLCPVCAKDRNENPCKCQQTGYHSFPIIKKQSKKEQ